MRVSIDAVREAGKLCEGAICYTGDILDPDARQIRPQILCRRWPRSWKAAGAHILGVKDMAGLLQAARGADAGQGAERGDRPADPLPHPRHVGHRGGDACWRRSRPASTPSMRRWMRCRASPRSPASARSSRRCATPSATPASIRECIRQISFYWEAVRTQYRAFESDLQRPAPRRSICTRCRAASSPTSRSRRARSASRPRWHEVAQAYADVNEMFGDIVKVTPSSKVVGDMALMMVSSGLTRADVLDPDKDVAFPASVVQIFQAISASRRRLAAGAAEEGAEGRDADHRAARLAAAGRSAGAAYAGAKSTRARPRRVEFASWLMYPKVFADFDSNRRRYGDMANCRRWPFSTGSSPDRKSASTWKRARRWSCAT